MNETTIRATADTIIELQMDKLGYEYVNLDDWYSNTDTTLNK